MFRHILIFLLVCAAFAENDIKLETEIRGQGYHKMITYSIIYDDEKYESCTFYLKQNLPSATFINCNELNEVQRLNKVNKIRVIHPERVDTELTTEKSKPLAVLIYGILDSWNDELIKLPIHFRYHEPKPNRKFVNVELDDPTMYLNCPKNPNKNSQKYCLNGTSFHVLKNANGTDYPIKHNCNWIIIQYESEQKKVFQTEIPVGDNKLFTTVKWLTLIISCIAGICTIFTIFKKHEKLRGKIK